MSIIYLITIQSDKIIQSVMRPLALWLMYGIYSFEHQ